MGNDESGKLSAALRPYGLRYRGRYLLYPPNSEESQPRSADDVSQSASSGHADDAVMY